MVEASQVHAITNNMENTASKNVDESKSGDPQESGSARPKHRVNTSGSSEQQYEPQQYNMQAGLFSMFDMIP